MTKYRENNRRFPVTSTGRGCKQNNNTVVVFCQILYVRLFIKNTHILYCRYIYAVEERQNENNTSPEHRSVALL